MKSTRIILALLLASASGLALADASGSREDRMQSALDNYRHSPQGRAQAQAQGQRDMNAGPAARAEGSIKRGAHNAGQAIKHGAQRAGHAIGTGLHKTGEAIGHAGSKLKAKSTDSTDK